MNALSDALPNALIKNLPREAWLTAFRALRRYHRYEVLGMEHLERPGAVLIVSYHGRPLALDNCMLTVSVYERLGYLPHGVIHGYFGENPALRWLIDGLGFVTGDGEEIAQAVAQGEHILVQPGGTREGCRSVRHRYEVDWGERIGYLRLALKYRLPIVPVAGAGVDDGYIGLNDGYVWGQRLGLPHRLPLWLGVGIGGLWPLALPLPVKMTQIIGEPIDLHLRERIDREDRQALLTVHRVVIHAVQALLDQGQRLGRRDA
jgi:hypothetical protein